MKDIRVEGVLFVYYCKVEMPMDNRCSAFSPKILPNMT